MKPHRRGVAGVVFRPATIILLFTAILWTACSHSPSTYRNTSRTRTVVHVVSQGQTLAQLARTYGVPVSRIARANGIRNPDSIHVGQRLTIPGAILTDWGGRNQPWQSKTPGIYHPLAPGETLMALERVYGVRAGVLQRINHIEDETRLRVGRRIFVPGAERVVHPSVPRPAPGKEPVRVAKTSRSRSNASTDSPPPRSRVKTTPKSASTSAHSGGSGNFMHPLGGRGTITSDFGDRSSGFHYGVDIGAPEGTAVYAVDSGEVEYVGNTKDPLGKTLGNHLMVYHPRTGLRSLYGHCRKVLVREGQSVKRGQVIAEVGHTGRVRGPTGNHLHLEIRNEDGVALDPAIYVPGID